MDYRAFARCLGLLAVIGFDHLDTRVLERVLNGSHPFEGAVHFALARRRCVSLLRRPFRSSFQESAGSSTGSSLRPRRSPAAPPPRGIPHRNQTDPG